MTQGHAAVLRVQKFLKSQLATEFTMWDDDRADSWELLPWLATLDRCAPLPFGSAECVAACCSVLHCVAVCCSVSQCIAVCCSVVQCGAVCCSVLQCVAVCCSAACNVSPLRSFAVWFGWFMSHACQREISLAQLFWVTKGLFWVTSDYSHPKEPYVSSMLRLHHVSRMSPREHKNHVFKNHILMHAT